MPDQQPPEGLASKFADDAERREAAACMVHRMLGRRPWSYILKALKNRFEISDEKEVHELFMTVVRRLKLQSDPYDAETRRMAMREQYLRMIQRIENDQRFAGAGMMPEVAAAKQYEALTRAYDKLAKLDALYLSDHVKAKAVEVALAGKLSDDQLDQLISAEVKKKLEATPTHELEAEIGRRKAS